MPDARSKTGAVVFADHCGSTLSMTRADWEQFWEDVSSDQKIVKADGYSVHYYDYDRNDPNRANPFIETPDYTEL